MESSYSPITKKMECAKCRKPANLACSSCKDAPLLQGDSPVVHYCNAECQRSDWKRNKPTCNKLKDRKKLYRVMIIAQDLYYIYRELTWNQLVVEKIEKVHDGFIIRATVRVTPIPSF